MPIPQPNQGESKKKFINRCMSDPTMNKEFPDGDQRYKVCLEQMDMGKTFAAKVVAILHERLKENKK